MCRLTFLFRGRRSDVPPYLLMIYRCLMSWVFAALNAGCYCKLQLPPYIDAKINYAVANRINGAFTKNGDIMFNLVMQAAPAGPVGGPGGFFIQIMPFILIMVIFYFLLIRPQNKRMKEHRAMLDAVKRGDTVVTNGGLIGKVLKVNDDDLLVDLGEGQKVKVVRTMLSDVRNPKPANDPAPTKKQKK